MLETLQPKRFLRTFRNALFDLRYGGFCGGIKESPFAHLGYTNSVNTDYQVLDTIFSGKISSTDVLVDVGCGKGRVLNWWLHHAPKNKIYGIERDPELAERVRKRLSNFENVNIISGDLFDHWPDDANLFYLFNPFKRDLMERFKERALRVRRNPLKIFYYNPVALDVFEDSNRFNIETFSVGCYDHKVAMITCTGT